MPKKIELTLGCDPEFFLKKEGAVIPAEVSGITGTKKNPAPLKSGGAVQIDGLALEFNIQPAKNAGDFVKNISMALADIRSIVDKELEFSFVPDATFAEREWGMVTEPNKELGCEPDYDAYTMEQKTPPQGSADKPFRTAAGHIHIGFTSGMNPEDMKHVYDCSIISQFLDKALGQCEYAWAPPSKRKELYGSFGSFRPKSYGLEYRVLGNDWIKTPQMANFIFCYVRDLVTKALTGGIEGSYPFGRPSMLTPNAASRHICSFISTEETAEAFCRAILAGVMTPSSAGLAYMFSSIPFKDNVFLKDFYELARLGSLLDVAYTNSPRRTYRERTFDVYKELYGKEFPHEP